MLDGKETLKKKKPKILPDNILVIKSNIMDVDADESLGTVEIGFFLDAVKKEIEKQIKIFVLGLVGLLAIVILIMFFYLSFSIISPVVLLAKAAENLDDESVAIDTKRTDELGSLGRKFVEMRDAVRKRVDDLKTMNAKIEMQVKERTAELNKERNNIANLLNNMRQAVFTVSADAEIMGPVSSFSEEIFGTSFIGKGVYETIYNGIDQKSEQFASIKSVMTCVYGSDDLQWDIMRDYLPTRLTYKSNGEKEEEDKIIKVAYNPLWDNDEMLERIMFVAEDITELEKLEKKMAAQKEAASRNMQMLQELAAGKQDDLRDFFASANQMIQDCQAITKKIRESLNEGKELEGFDILFRHLHTIKGNSRVFSLSLISTVVHDVESKVTEFIGKTLEINETNINEFIQDLYLIQGQINEYTKVAKEVFNFNFGGDSNQEVLLFNLIKEFELKTSYLISSHSKINKTRLKEVDKKLQSWIKENKNRDVYIKDLKRISHSLKGLTRGMDERALSNEIHTFESGLNLASTEDLVDKADWDKSFMSPLEKIKEQTRSVYFKSESFREFNDKSETWSKFITNAFNLTNLTLHQKGANKEKIRNTAYKIKTQGNEIGLDYIPLIMDRIEYLNEKSEESEDIKICLKELWSFLFLLISLDTDKYNDRDQKKVIKRALTVDSGIKGIPPEYHRTTLQLFLIEIEGQGFSLNEVLKDLGTIFEQEKEEIVNYLVPETNLGQPITVLFSALKKRYQESNLKNNLKNISKLDPSFGKICESAFLSKDLFWFTCVKEIALLRLLKTYSESEDSSLEDSKPQILEVLYSNFEDFKLSLKEEENIEPSVVELLKSKCEKLLDLPVKYSFNKFRPVIKEVAGNLNKKIKFKLSGDQGSLNKDKLFLLQDSMMHLVRNSLDHGIESPDVRVAKGKPESGTVEIECLSKDPKNLRIIIRDDGGGIDADRVCEKGVQQGLINEAQAKKMSHKEKLDLIFASTLSTKEEVSEISGRGVGMDVVKKNLEELGSKIEIQTELGKGTEFIIDIAI